MDLCFDAILSEEYGDFIFNYDNDFRELAEIEGFCFDTVDNSYAIVYAHLDTVPNNVFQQYGYRVYPSCFGLMDLPSLDASGVTRTKAMSNLDFNGDGVLVAIIDTGIDYTHPSFIKADGTSKIHSIWDQTIQSENKPENFYYGSEYNNEMINLALASPDPLSIVPSTDDIGHGTYLSGVACGNLNLSENISGVAPNAELLVVKLKQAKTFVRDFFKIPRDSICYQENDIMLAIKYVLDVAATEKKPMSICISLGTSQGGHDARGALSSYLSTIAAMRGICVTIAAGNEGSSGHHFSSTLDKNSEYDTVELNVGPNLSGFSMEFWGDTPSTFSIDILSPAGEYIPRIPARLGESRVINLVFEETTIYVDYQLIEAQTGDQLILVRFEHPSEGTWRFRVYTNSDLNLRYHVWLPITEFLGTTSSFIRPDPDFTLTSPGNTYVPIIVTAYNPSTQSIYRNSSRGFTRVNDISPDFAAPGVNIKGPSPGGTYTIKSGTSVAAALTAGIGVMFLEWGIVNNNFPTIDTIEIRNLLIRGAKRDTNIIYPNTIWGYGIIDVYNTFISLRGDQNI